MLPAAPDEVSAFCEAFDECRRGLAELDDHMLEPNAARWVATIRRCLVVGSEGVDTATERWRAAVDRMSYVDRDRFAGAVDCLADWLLEANLRT